MYRKWTIIVINIPTYCDTRLLVWRQRLAEEELWKGATKGPCMPPGTYFYHESLLAESVKSWQQPYLHI